MDFFKTWAEHLNAILAKSRVLRPACMALYLESNNASACKGNMHATAFPAMYVHELTN